MNKTYKLNNNEYVQDSCLEQYELAAQIIAESKIEVDFEKDSEPEVQKKISQFVGYLIKNKRSKEFLFYALKRKDELWDREKQKEYEKDFESIAPFEFTVIVGSFFLQFMQIYSGYFGGLKASTGESNPQNEALKD